MNIILMGAPGAGKGTQAKIISNMYKIPHISTGDIFRSHMARNTSIGIEISNRMNNGQLVPDELTEKVLLDRIQEEDCKNGYVLDGFPRTLPQAKFLHVELAKLHQKIDFVINLEIEDHEVISRVSGRRVCGGCGEPYHILYAPPNLENTCDECQQTLCQREDDKEETVKKRLVTYHKITEPLVQYYKELGILSVVQSCDHIEDTTDNVLKILS
jgi:adenylate kinase